MKRLLLLDNRHTPDTSDMWRTAMRLGWKTERTHAHRVVNDCLGYDQVRYYGNTLHASGLLMSPLPFEFIPLPVCLHRPELRPYLRRRVDMVRRNLLSAPMERDTFVKPAREKWFEARVYKAGESITPDGGNPDDECYVSELARFDHEVRCFTINGQVLTASYYRVDGVVWDVTGLEPEQINYDESVKDTPIPQMVAEIARVVPDLPPGVVMDFWWDRETDQWSLIEFNEAWASGLYYTDYAKALECIVASQRDRA